MISLELAKQLKESGLKWTPQDGDKYWLPCPDKADDWKKDSWDEWTRGYLSTDSEHHYEELWWHNNDWLTPKDEVVWIPNLNTLIHNIECHKFYWILRMCSQSDLGKYRCKIAENSEWLHYWTHYADTPEEAVGKALLWILKNREDK